MSITSSKRNNQGILSRAGAFLRGKRDWMEIPGYQVGDIRSDKPVFVAATAAIAGDIIAPKIIISGLLYGSAGAPEVTITGDGQVWGDVYTSILQVEPGGKIHGWISTLHEDDAGSLLKGEASLKELATIDQPALLTDLEARGLTAILPTELVDETSDRLEIMRQLQAAAGAALVARAELEQAFDERLTELAGNAINEADSLRKSLALSEENVATLQGRLDTVEMALHLRDEEVVTQAEALTAVRERLQERLAELQRLQVVSEQQAIDLSQMSHANDQLVEQLSEAIERGDSLSTRVENLESALQASLQRSSEQEEALVRWQELADATEKKASDLERQLERVSMQLAESTKVAELLRAQREKVQDAWDKSQADLGTWQNRAEMAQTELAEIKVELETLQEQSQNQTPAATEAIAKLEKAEAALAAAGERIEELEKRLEQAEAEVQDYYDQLLWYKESLKTTTLELEEARQVGTEQTTQLEHLNGELAARQTQVDKWKTNIGRMTELLYEAEQRVKDMQTEMRSVRKSLTTEAATLRESLRRRQLQLAAYEAEIERYHTEIEAQGKRLAEAQANLIEQEVELNRARSTAMRHSEEMNKIKQLAAKRIQTLEEEVARTHQQLKDLSVWLERRQRREGSE